MSWTERYAPNPTDSAEYSSLQLDASSRAFLSAAGLKAPSGPLSQAFACDGLDNESIKSAIKDIQAAWPDRHIGTGIFNFSVRKRGPFL